MIKFHPTLALSICTLLLVSCGSTKSLNINAIVSSPVNFSSTTKKIGIINASKSVQEGSYTTKLEQMIFLEKRWLAEKATNVTLDGLFNELVQDQRFDTVEILEDFSEKEYDFNTEGVTESAWEIISTLCEENKLDAIFVLTSHEAETKVLLKKGKTKQSDMMRNTAEISGKEITLETVIEHRWKIYDPKQRIVIDEFKTNKHIVSSATGVNSVDAFQAIDHRRETLLEQSKISGSSYGTRMNSQKLDVQREYYVVGTRNFALADTKIKKGNLDEAMGLWEKEVQNPNIKISGRACHNIAVLNEFNGDLSEALSWALKSYSIYKDDTTLEYISALKRRRNHERSQREQLATNNFSDD